MMTKIFFIVITLSLLNSVYSQSILPVLEMNDLFINDPQGSQKRVFIGGKGQLDFSKFDVSSVTAGLRMFYKPVDEFTVMLSINKDKIAEKIQYDSTDYLSSVLFPENTGFVFSGGLYFPIIKIFTKQTKNGIINELSSIRNKKRELENDSKKESDGLVKQQISYKLTFDELVPFVNFNAFNRTVNKDAKDYKFTGVNLELGSILNWYLYTEEISFRAFVAPVFGYTKITNGKDDYISVYKLGDTSKTVPTSLTTLGCKVGVQFKDLLVSFNVKWYVGSEENIINSLVGPQWTVTTGVNGNFFKF
jgi:hypothetical protein